MSEWTPEARAQMQHDLDSGMGVFEPSAVRAALAQIDRLTLQARADQRVLNGYRSRTDGEATQNAEAERDTALYAVESLVCELPGGTITAEIHKVLKHGRALRIADAKRTVALSWALGLIADKLPGSWHVDAQGLIDPEVASEEIVAAARKLLEEK